MSLAEKLEKVFQGDDTRRGVVFWNQETGKKNARQERTPFDFSSHLNSNPIQGLSPYNLREKGCMWGVIDIDQKIAAADFCSKLWIYDYSLFPFKSLNGNWHVYKFWNSFCDVKVVKEVMKKIEKDLIGKGYNVDKGHTLPTGYGEDRTGSWIIIPYAKNNVCYSPKGNPLTIEQFLYRYQYKHLPLIQGAVGMRAKDGRHKALFNATMEQKYHEVGDWGFKLEDLNSQFTDPIKSQKEIENAKGISAYDEDHFKKNYNNYLGELCNDDVPFEKNKKEEEEKPKRKKGLTSYNFNEFTTKKYPSVFYYLYPIISNESIVLGWSLPGVGKTLFTFDLLFHVSQGKNFLHWNHNKPEDPPSVLYVEFEMSSKQLQDRALEIAERENFKIKSENFRVATLGDQPNGQYRMLTTPEGREDIEVTANEMFEKTGKKPIIVIDNIRFALGNFDEKEGKEWIPFVLWCAQMRSKGFSIIYLHHAVNTGNKFSGSGYGNSNVNVEFQLRLPTEAEEDPEYDVDDYTQFVFQFKKMRENVLGQMQPFIIVTCKKTHRWFKIPLLSKTERQIKELYDDGKSVKDIVTHGKAKELDGFSKANVHKVIKKIGAKDDRSR